MDPALTQLLAQVGRPGWIVTGSKDETKRVSARDENNQVVTTDQPTGNKILTIVSPDGRTPDTIIVTPPAQSAPVGSSTAWPTDPNGNPTLPPGTSASYTVIQGPTKNLPAGSTGSTTSPSEQNEAALNVERTNNASTSKYGRVTNAELTALQAKEIATGRQLTNDETTQTLSQAREDRLAAADARTAANQTAAGDRATAAQQASNEIARARLALDQQKAAQPNTHVVNNKLVDDTGNVIFDGGTDSKIIYRDTPGGGVVAIDPAHLDQPPTVVLPDKPPKPAPPSLVPGQKPDQRQLLQQDPTTGALSVVNNPLPPPPNPSVQQWQQMQDGITQIQGMMARGEIGAAEGQQYVDALHKNFQAALQGTTPYQQYQDQQTAALTRSSQATSLLNQRVQAGSGLASSLVNSAVGIASNKNFMDPSAVAGLSIFGGANNVPDFINQIGGGQGTLDAATGAAKAGLTGGSDPASAFLNAALGGGSPGGAPASAQPSYGGENIGSGAARNPQPPVAPIAPVAGVQPVAGAIQQQPAFAAGHMAPTSGYDPAAILLQAALRGGLQSY